MTLHREQGTFLGLGYIPVAQIRLEDNVLDQCVMCSFLIVKMKHIKVLKVFELR